MTPARISVLVAALVASVALAFVVHNLAARPRAAAVAAQGPASAQTQVLVAKTDLGVGSVLSADNMRWQDWPAANLDPDYITSGTTSSGGPAALVQAKNVVANVATGGGPKLQAMVGAIVRDEIGEGEPITAKKIVRAGQSSYMAVRLPPGMRAMALPLSVESGAGGFIEPGDRVDVLSTHTDSSKAGGGLVTDTVMPDALVLAIDQHTDAAKGDPSLPGATITLEVPAGMAYGIAKARAQGGLTLALRSYADAGPGAGAGPVADHDDAHAVRIFRGGAPAEVVSAQ